MKFDVLESHNSLTYALFRKGFLTVGVVGFVVGIPFQNSSLGYSWGGPFNYLTATYLHGADLAYYVGGAVAFLIAGLGVFAIALLAALTVAFLVASCEPRFL